MNDRRINDMLRLAGPLLGFLNELLPMLPEGRTKHFVSGLCFALAFLGTRGMGMEYQDVANAKAEAAAAQKVVASIMPPPLPAIVVPPSVKSGPQ